jgi:hypothetical protein
MEWHNAMDFMTSALILRIVLIPESMSHVLLVRLTIASAARPDCEEGYIPELFSRSSSLH